MAAHLLFSAAGASCIMATATMPRAAARRPAMAPMTMPLSPSAVMPRAIMSMSMNEGITTAKVETSDPSRPLFLYPT